MGQKKERNGQKRVHLHALHGHVKKPSDIEDNINLAISEAHCCICIYIFGFGILWGGLGAKSFLALVPVQNGGGRSSSKNSPCHNAYLQLYRLRKQRAYISVEQMPRATCRTWRQTSDRNGTVIILLVYQIHRSPSLNSLSVHPCILDVGSKGGEREMKKKALTIC